MSYKIVNKQMLGSEVKRLVISAPEIAHRVRPGQFVSVCPEEGDERLPLTVVEADAARGTIVLIFRDAGHTLKKLGEFSIDESVFSILGPLGVPAQIKKKGVVVGIATGIGVAQILPIIRAYRKAGNKVIGIIGARTKKDLLLEPQMRLACTKLLLTTEDGSYERRGLATTLLRELLEKEQIDCVYAVGAVDMMQTVCALTKERKIETRVQLTPVMVDGVGLCGACRVKAGGKIVLACIEGPEFNGHSVDFDDLKIRMKAFKESDQWRNLNAQSSPVKNESGIFTRFLADILKS